MYQRGMDYQIMIHLYNGILLSNAKEISRTHATTQMNLRNIRLKEKGHSVKFHVNEILEQAKLTYGDKNLRVIKGVWDWMEILWKEAQETL